VITETNDSRTLAARLAETSSAPPAPTWTKLTRRIKRQNVALLVTASILGLWLGVAAPAVSPVAPFLPTPAAASVPTPDTVTEVPAVPDQPDRVGRGAAR
jgi:hypothetical protein